MTSILPKFLSSSGGVGDGAAQLTYGANGYQIIRDGSYVICAVSGAQIALEELRYWSVVRQEAYASAALALQQILPIIEAKRGQADRGHGVRPT